DLELHQIAPPRHPFLQQQRVVRLHQLEAAIEVGFDPAIDIFQTLRHAPPRFAQTAIDRAGVAIAEALDDHEQHPFNLTPPVGILEIMGCGNSGFNQISNAIRPGARKVFCVKFQREMEGLDEIPFEGHALGQKIYDNVSKDAWKMWVEHM